ncbi:hypothetical protein AAFF_G00156100 [Aldrovandia affinis]|uniref:KIAA1522 n=1 Tax=Aldrovandia affinis TaxID=143900 RepID=A0AAD7W969_9TELE|nr:hypothetical protein AAFF_G00156100 [Aldrovandia affinis]
MSGRNSVGDLVPRDITEILARESKTKGKNKHRGSFSRAFSWLKGGKKKGASNGQSRGGRAGESRAGKQAHQDYDSAKAAPKQEDERKLTVHYKASRHYQENVFIEGSRPQYLEDLHIEAQEGLKIQQQEEHENGADYQDVQSVTSTVERLQPEEDSSTREGEESLESGSTATETVSTGSTVSTRSLLMRQGSTFKPLNPVKRLDKSRKRSRRTTIMGIPHHVQKELGLERGQLFKQNADGQLPNGGEGAPGIIVIPTIDGEVPEANHEGARVHLQNLEALQSSKEEELLKRHIQAVYRQDLMLNHKMGPRLSPMQRPKSLAVPGMTTGSFLQEPQGPVMSISPQATYLSKIIPNAVMPAAVDVIEISRSRSRSSVRTVSKSSLVTASPASSRSSAPQGLSSISSNWSHSQSSETIISNSSTISSKGSASTSHVPNGTEEARELPQRTAMDQVSIGSSISWVSSDSAGAKQRAESGPPTSREEDYAESLQNDRAFVRSLSVMKTKMPPAPPRRTYSLHHEKIKRRSRELVDIKDISDPRDGDGNMPWAKAGKINNAAEESLSPVIPGSAGSPAYFADSSSLDNSRSSTASSPLSADHAATREGVLTQQLLSGASSPQKLPSPANRFERTMSPSSGYSSQSGTPTLSTKVICPPSPGKKKAQPVKPERLGSRLSPATSISSSLTSLSSGASDPTLQLPKPSPPIAVTSTKVTPPPAAVTLREMFDIPPPPNVKAPSPPPPETWMHNKRTFELLCGSNTFAARIAALQKQQQQQTEPHQVQKPEVKSDELSPVGTQPQEQDKTAVLSGKEECMLLSKEEPMPVQNPDHSLECASESLPIRIEASLLVQMKEEEIPVVEKKEKASSVMQRQEQEVAVTQKKEKEHPVVQKKEPPPVMKKTSPMVHMKEPNKVQEKLLVQSTEASIEVKIHTPPQEDMSAVQKEEANPNDMSKSPISEKTTTPQSSMQTLSVGAPTLSRVSPPPSPPPAHHPPPPPSKKTTTISVSSPLPEENVEASAAESSWPPPPPPMEESSEMVFEGQDESDFPPPPPPVLQDPLIDRVESCPVVSEILETSEGSSNSEGSLKSEETTTEVLEVALNVSVTPIKPTEINASHSETCVHVQLSPSSAQPHGNEPKIQDSLPPQETPPLQEVVQPPTQEAPPLQEEVTPAQVIPPLQEKTLFKHQEASQEDIPPPPQEAPPPPPMVPGVLPPAPPVNSTPETSTTVTTVSSVNVPYAPLLPAENQAPVSFRRQPSLANRESKGKDLLSRTKSAPMPKEDANIPLVTPSLLQMVRLRSVNVDDDQGTAPCEDCKHGDGSNPSQHHTQSQASSQSVPQKPIRKSLSLKSPSATVASPSMRLQEAIRMKTAAMSSRDGLPARLSLRSSVSSPSSAELGVRSPRLPEGDLQKSPASTASFIFSRSTKKVVIETPSSPEAQSNLKRSLVAELMQVSDQTKLVAANGKPSTQTKKLGKVPPPVAKKPTHGPNLSDKPVCPNEKTGNFQCELSSSSPMVTEANGETEGVQPAGQQALPKEGQDTSSHQETANTVKVSLNS